MKKQGEKIARDSSYSDSLTDNEPVDKVRNRNARMLATASSFGNASDSEGSSKESRYDYKFTSDADGNRNTRVQFVDPKYGVTYTRAPTEEHNLKPIPDDIKKSIAKKKLKDMEVDPYLEFGQKAIAYTEAEKNQFYEFTKNIIKDKQLRVDNYIRNTPEVFGNYNDELDEPVDGMKNISGIPKGLLKDRIYELPDEIWDNPLCFVTGKLLTMLRLHDYTREVDKNIYCMLAQEVHKRTLYTRDDIHFIFKRAGLTWVKDTGVGLQSSIPEYILSVFRFVDIKPEQHLEEEKKNAQVHEDTSNIDWETLSSFLEDRVCLNAILIPEYNKDFKLNKEQYMQNNVQKNKSKQEQKVYDKSEELENSLSIEQRMKLEANNKFVLGCIFYSM